MSGDAGDLVTVECVADGAAGEVDPLQLVLHVDDGDRVAAVGRGEAAVGVDARPVGQLPQPHADHPVGQLHRQPHPERAAGVVADAPRVVALAPPVVDLVRASLVGVRAAVRARLEHVALVPDQLVPGAHRAPPQAVRRRAGGERDVHGDGHLDAVLHLQAHGAVGLDDLDLHRADVERVRVVAGLADVASHRRRVADHAELQRVELATRREQGHRQDDHVAEPVARVHHEEEALPPVLVMGDDAGQRLGDLVDEVLVEGGQPGHGHSPWG